MNHFSELLRQQYGVATTTQAQLAGISREAQMTMVRSGMLAEPASQLLVLVGAARTWHQRATIATLGTHPQAALSHGSAARLLALDGFDRFAPMHVTVPHGHRPNVKRVDVVVHQTRRWEEGDVIRRDGIAVRSVP